MRKKASGSAISTIPGPSLPGFRHSLPIREYRALKREGAYVQAWWIADQLGHSPMSRFALLQRSIWATRDPALRQRLIARFAEHGPALVAQFPQEDMRKRYSQLLVVNALRELGRFHEALAALDAIDFAAAVNNPGESNYGYADQLRLAIGQRDDGRFAVETLPRQWISLICNNAWNFDHGPTSPANKASCKIRRDREEQEERDRLLDEIAASELAKDGPALAAKCDANDKENRDRVKRHACRNYTLAIEKALGEQLPDDPEAHALFCSEEAMRGDAEEDYWLRSACRYARGTLQDREEERLLADPARLAVVCPQKEEVTKNDARLDVILSRVCATYELDQVRAALAPLASDVAAFDRACAKFRKTNSAGDEVYRLSEAGAQCRWAWRMRKNERARAAAEAKGLKCLDYDVFSHDRPNCVSPEEHAREMVRRIYRGDERFHHSYFNEGSSLMEVAHVRAAAIIAEAKRIGRRPDKL
ncbi:hypothetical protein [Altererythrobacter sp. BO-6]|uniref:hypothetical protein n=1 Tax=Altererythrobacter sp. BO-6 TaxID=2604537 RepID=UPI0019D1565A|nr:hypothetical protein [Altererythrobacter sp. BO-6]